MRRLPVLLTIAGLALAAGSGFLASTALGTAGQATRTVTVNIPTGERGPQGPPGPAGPACPSGFEPGVLVINAPGGQVRTFTCLG